MEVKRELTEEEQLKRNPLYITEKEKAAMQIYGAMEPSKDLYPAMRKYLEFAYGLINAVFFEGIENELTRIVDDKKELSAGMIEHSDEMMEMILALYSAMYKYGKTMKENVKTHRVERKESADEMLQRGELISNTSTALYGYDKISFGKKQMQLMEIYIQKNTPCVDYKAVLGGDYTLSTESEVLIMPGCKVRKIEEEFGETPKAKNVLRVWVSPPDMPEPLTEEELKKKEELTKVYLDKQTQEDAKQFISLLRFMSVETKDEVLEMVEQEEIDAYMKWKTAFITVARYSMREIVLEIEEALEKQKENTEPLELTEKEKIALQIYGGAMPKTTMFPVLSNYESSYCIINSLFFPGIETELTRILDDEKELEPKVIEAADELIEVIEALYSAMYKCGKKMDKPKKAYRIERTSSIEEIKKRGTTVSNTSTTKIKSFEFNFFVKYDNTYLEINIEAGTPCFDYEETFTRKEYILAVEREILIAPGCKIVLAPAEDDYTWMTEEQRNKLYKATISAPEKAKPLSEKEEEDKKKMLEIFEDEDLRSNAVNVIRKINEYYENEFGLTFGNPKAREEARDSLSELEIEQYTKWKSAFLEFIRYRFREIALEIEAELQGQVQYKAGDTLKLTQQNLSEINEETIRDMIENAVLNGNNEVEVEKKGKNEGK